MFVLVLNASNVEPNSNNNTLVYNFPNSIQLKDKYITVSQIVMYYSWFNILSEYQNNTIKYTLNIGGVLTDFNIVIPDGLYEIVDINNYIQYSMIQNGAYLINSVGDNVYYFELLVNPNRYAIQLNTMLFPSVLPVGYSTPANFIGFPSVPFNPIITFPASFNKIVGYGAGFVSANNANNAYVAPTASINNNYVSKNTGTGTISYLSNTNPDVQPNSSIYLSISNINNPYSQPSSIIYAITPNVAIGEQIIETPPNFMWNKMIDGTYSQLRIQLLGIDKRPITMKDPNMTIMLSIRDASENLIGLK